MVRACTTLVCGLSAVPASSLLKNLDNILDNILSLITNEISCDMTSATGTKPPHDLRKKNSSVQSQMQSTVIRLLSSFFSLDLLLTFTPDFVHSKELLHFLSCVVNCSLYLLPIYLTI